MVCRLKYIISTLLLCVWVTVRTTAQSLPLVEPMKDLVEMYEALNRAFPYSDYVTLKQNEVCYWVNRSMRPEYDFLGTFEKLKPMIEKLKSLPSKGERTIRENDPAEGIVFACYPNFHDDTQENYVELVFNRNLMHFCYISRNKNAVLGHEAHPAIVEEMEKLFGEYVSRKDVGSVGVIYDGPTYQYQLVTFNNSERIRQHAEGTIYIIPNGTEADWQRIFEQIKNYALVHNVQVAWNDVYRDGESVEILIDRESTVPIVFAAALKDGELKLLRLEGTADYNIVLPRIWSEDSPVFNPKKNKDYLGK